MNQTEYRLMYEAEESHWWYAGLHELILSTVADEEKQLNRKLQIFDAGCGTGRLMQLMAEAGHSVSGCDFADEALLFCEKRGIKGVIKSDLNSLELEPEKYDLITSIDVLYHNWIEDDAAVMKRFCGGLKPGGVLILNLVAFEFLRSRHDAAVHTRERYRLKSAAERVRSAGFRIRKGSYRVSILFPLIAAYRLFGNLFLQTDCDPSKAVSDVYPPLPFVNRFLYRLISFENRLLKVSSLPFGSSIFVVAEKAAAGQ